MKTDLTLYVTVRLVSGKNIDIMQLSEDIFQDRILPYKWERPFYLDGLRRKSMILVAGQWMTSEYRYIDSEGNIVNADDHLPVLGFGPVGVGPYKYKKVDFYRSDKFACFNIMGGTYRRPKTTSLNVKTFDPNATRHLPSSHPGPPGPVPEKDDPDGMPHSTVFEED